MSVKLGRYRFIKQTRIWSLVVSHWSI